MSPAGRFYAGVDSWALEYSGNADGLLGMMAAGVRSRKIGSIVGKIAVLTGLAAATGLVVGQNRQDPDQGHFSGHGP